MKAISLLCLVVCCASRTPMRICTSQLHWEGRILQVDPSKQFDLNGRISYDEPNSRVRIIEEIQLGSTRDFYDTIHSQGTEYKLNLRTRRCTVTTLDHPFRSFGIPRFAKFVDEVEIGAVGMPGEHMVVRVWVGEFQDKSTFVTTASYPGCIPISSLVRSNQTGVVLSKFYDISLGISDPMVFMPPAECI